MRVFIRSSRTEGPLMLFWFLAFSPLLFFFLLIAVILTAPVTGAQLTPATWYPLVQQQQQQVLKNFFERTNGNGWSSDCRQGWPPTSSTLVCNSYGVTCTSVFYPFYGHILLINSLELSNCNLQGTLAASLAQLSRLQKLDLSNNRLTGSLPREWSTLVDLQFLSLCQNLLVGTLPTQWSAMQRIQHLYLHANNLRGPVPTSWKLKMTSLVSSFRQVSCRTSSEATSLMTCAWVSRKFLCEMVTVAYNCISPPYGGFEPSCIGVQRNDCPFASHSASVSDSSTLRLSATPLPSPSVTLSASFSPTSTNNSPSIGGTTGWVTLSITVTPTLSTKEEEETQSRTLVPSPTSTRAAATQTVSLLESVSTSVALFSISTESVQPSSSLSVTWSSSPRSHTEDKTFSESVQQSKSLSVSVSNELDATPSVLSSRSHTLPVPSPPAGIPPALKSAVVAMGSVAAAGSLLGVDPGGAAVQAALTFLACRKEAPVSDGSFDSWLSTLPVSPFLPLGLIWGALGSVGLAAFFVVLQATCVTVLYTFRRYHHHHDRTAGAGSGVPSWLDAASVLRFPWVSIIAAEALLAGLAVCGAAAASGAAGNEHVVAGWVSVTLSLAAVVAWYIAASRLVKPCHAVSTESVMCAQSSLAILKNHGALIPPLYAVLQRSCEWVPVAYTQRNGAFFDAMRGGDGWWWRWVSVAVLTLVAGVTGAGGTRGGGCITSLSVCAVVLLITAILLALVRPFAMPSENVLNPLKFTLLGCTCATIASVEGDREASILAVLGTLQTVVMVLRLTIRVYTRIEVMYWNYRSGIALTRANEDKMKTVQKPRPISPPPLAQNMIHVVSPSSIPPLAGNEGPPPPLRDEEEDAVLFTLLQGTEYANSDDDDLLLRSSGGTLHHHHHGRANAASCNNNGGFFSDVFSLSSLTKEELKAVGIQQI